MKFDLVNPSPSVSKTLAGRLAEMELRAWMKDFLYHVMTAHTPNGTDWKQVFKLSDDAPSEVDVSVTVNGVEVPFDSFINTLVESHSNMLKASAKELLDSHFCNVIDTLTKMQEHAKQKLECDVLPSWEKEQQQHTNKCETPGCQNQRRLNGEFCLKCWSNPPPFAPETPVCVVPEGVPTYVPEGASILGVHAMTLEDAIAHAQERAKGNDVCSAEHAQLATWLTELRLLRGAPEACANYIMAGLGNLANGQRTPSDWPAYVAGECDALRAGAWKQHVVPESGVDET